MFKCKTRERKTKNRFKQEGQRLFLASILQQWRVARASVNVFQLFRRRNMHLKLAKTLINDRSTKNIIYFAQGFQNKKFYHTICNDRKTFLTDVAWITFRRLSFAFSHLKVKPQILFIIERNPIDSRRVLDRDDRTRK